MEIACYGLEVLSRWSNASQSWASSGSMSGEPVGKGCSLPASQPRKPREKHWEGSRNPGLQCQLCQSLAAFFYLVSEVKDPRLHRAIKIRLGEKYFATMKEISSSIKMAEKITLN